MCGRYKLSTPGDELWETFDIHGDAPELVPRFNIAPTQPIAVIREPHKLEMLRWGLKLPNPKAGGFKKGAKLEWVSASGIVGRGGLCGALIAGSRVLSARDGQRRRVWERTPGLERCCSKKTDYLSGIDPTPPRD